MRNEVGGSSEEEANINRRRFIQGSVGAGLVTAAGLRTSAPAMAQETSPGEGIWRFETGDYVVSSPTVVNGTVYIGSNDGTLYAINAETGEQEWAFTDPDHWIRSSPAVSDETVYFGTENGVEHEGHVYALDAASGEQNWVTETAIGPSKSSPTVADGSIYFPGEGSGTGERAGVYALDADTGAEQWHFEEHLPASPVVMNGTVYVGSRRGNDDSQIYAIDAESGDQVWESNAPDGDVRTAPAVSDGLVYVGAGLNFPNDEDPPHDQTLYAIDASTGETEWTFETTGRPSVTPTVEGGTVYIGTAEEYEDGEFQGNIHAVDATTGEERWAFSTLESDYFTTNIGSAPTIVDGTVFFGAFGLIALDAETGAEQWYFGPSNARSSPTIVDGVAFVGIDDGSVYAIDAGVEGSSEDTRVLQGVLGHHHTWADESEQSLDMVVSYEPEEDESTSDSSGGDSDSTNSTTDTIEGGETTDTPDSDESESLRETGDRSVTAVFQRFSNTADSQTILGIAGIGTIGAAYAGYRKLRSEDETGEEAQRSSTKERSKPAPTTSEQIPNIAQYDDVKILESVREESGFQIQRATVANHSIWMLTPASKTGDTIATAGVERFNEIVEPWAGMAIHSNILSVYATGKEPLPWAAIEPANYPSFSERVDGLTVAETVNVLIQVCEAVHDVQRYGQSYDRLSVDSVLVSDSGDVRLLGVLDYLGGSTARYVLPSTDEDSATERAEVYRLGALAYEALTGRQPSHPDPTVTEANKSMPAALEEILACSLAASPESRYETVLHFRDELKKFSEQL